MKIGMTCLQNIIEIGSVVLKIISVGYLNDICKYYQVPNGVSIQSLVGVGGWDVLELQVRN